MQGAGTEFTLKQLLFAAKSGKVCKQERVEFDRCRATPVGAYGDPETCEGKAANFLQCHANIVAAKVSCEPQFAAAMACLKLNTGMSESMAGDGVGAAAVSNFVNCGN